MSISGNVWLRHFREHWIVWVTWPASLVALALVSFRHPEAPPAPTGHVRPLWSVHDPLKVDGITDPVLCPADEAGIGDEERVIGVVEGEEARAYLVAAFEIHDLRLPGDLAVHVVHDEIGGRQVCITHCDITRTTRVFGGANLPTIQVGGFDQGMVLVVDNQRYRQNDARLPLPKTRFEEVSWGEWRSRHPRTRLYVGQRRGRL
jgi:hypothetical protein